MATTRIMPLHVGKGRTESRAISDIIDYVANPQKTDADKIVVFQDGKVVEQGTHDELIASGSTYSHMWDTYTRETIGEE